MITNALKFGIKCYRTIRTKSLSAYVLPYSCLLADWEDVYKRQNRMTVSKIDENISKKITNHYIKLPLNLKAKFGIGLHLVKMYATAGPYAAYLISGEKIDLDEAAKDIKAKSFEAGANLGLGFEVLRIFQIGVNCGFKLTDNYKTDKPDWSDPLNGKTTCWSITGSIYL